MKHWIKKAWTLPMVVYLIGLSDHYKRAFHLTGLEKRKYPRVRLSIRVTRVETGSFSFCRAHNISLGGMFLKSRESLPKGTELHLRFSLFPHQGEIEVDGVVTWVQLPSPDDSLVPGMGIQFIRTSPEAQRTIKTFIAMKL